MLKNEKQGKDSTTIASTDAAALFPSPKGWYVLDSKSNAVGFAV